MRLPRLRFTVRRLMLVVALVGLVMGTGVWDTGGGCRSRLLA
jgi:hypothetical protein